MQHITEQRVSARIARALGARQAQAVPLTVAGLLAELNLDAGLLRLPLEGTPVSCLDIKAQGVCAREQGVPLVVDVSLMGPAGCAAIRLGAHLAVAAMGEHACAVAAAHDVERVLPGMTERLRALPRMDVEGESSIEQLLDANAQQWHLTSDAAQVVASYLRCHPRVAELRYPGLKEDPSFGVAARTLTGGFGPLVSYRLDGEYDWRSLQCSAEDARTQVMRLEAELSA